MSLSLDLAKSCVGDGWGLLVERAFKEAEGKNIKFQQVKEKFGELRIYFVHDCSDDLSEDQTYVCNHDLSKFYDYIRQLEVESSSICEKCGSPAEPRYETTWILTLCEQCNYERLKKRGLI